MSTPYRVEARVGNNATGRKEDEKKKKNTKAATKRYYIRITLALTPTLPPEEREGKGAAAFF